jgi:integrase
VCSCGEDLVRAKRAKRVNYWIAYRLPGGKQRRERIGGSIDEARDADGKRRIQKREHRIFEILPEARMTFQELTDWHLDLENVKQKKYYPILQISLAKFNRIFGQRIVADIKPSELEDYRAKRRGEGKAESTIDQEIAGAKVVVNNAFLDGRVSGEVLRRFKAIKKYLTGARRNSNQRTRVLTPVEFQCLEGSAPLHLKPILRAGYETGMREAEVLGLKWGMVSLKDQVITLPKEITKDHEARIIPLSENLCAILNRLPRGITTDYAVFSYKGKEIQDIRTGLKKACVAAKILYGRFKGGGFVYHDLRRTFFTDMRRAGAPVSVIKEICGHSRNEISDRYNQVDLTDMRAAIERLIRYREGEYAKVNQNVN